MLNLKKLLTKIINRFRVVNTGNMQTMGESGVYYMVNAVTDKPEATGGIFLLNRPTHDTGCGLYIPNTAYANLYKVSITNGDFTYTPIVSSTVGHKHAASDITSGTLSIARGGTGSTGTAYTETIANIITKGTNITISNARYAQWGKMAQISLVLKTTAALSGNTVVATLVDGKHPKTFTGATVNYDSVGIIYTNGAIHVNKSYASGTTLNIEATYILP